MTCLVAYRFSNDEIRVSGFNDGGIIADSDIELQTKVEIIVYPP